MMDAIMNQPTSAPEPETALAPEPVEGGPPPRRGAGKIGWRNTFSALRHRNFRLFLTGLIISSTGNWMEAAALGWLSYQLTNSTVLLGEVAAAGTAPMIIFSMVGGWVADHYPKRSILLVTTSVWTLTAFSIFTLTWTGMVQPWHIITIALINGVALGFDMPARQAFIMEMTSRDEIMNAISLNSSVVNCARIIGPATAGLIMAKTGPAFCFFINGASFLATIVALLMMRMPAHVRPVRAETAIKQVLSGFHCVLDNFRVLVLMILFTVVGIFGWSYGVLLPAFARDILHLGADGYGVLMASAGVGALTGGLIMASAGQLLPKRGTVFGSIWFFSVILILFALNRDHHRALAFLALNSFGMTIFFSMSTTQIQLSVPDEMRGRVMGVWALMFGSVIPIGSLEAGALARWAGIPATIITGAVICAGAAAVTFAAVRRRDAKT